MKAILLLVLAISSIASAQTIYDQQNVSNLFANGFYINDLSVFIPWNTPFDSIGMYGNPRIVKDQKEKVIVYWDSVKILNDVEITLRYFPLKFINNSYSNFKIVNGVMDSANTVKVINFFIDKIGTPRKINKKKNYTMYLWNLNFCNVFVFKTNDTKNNTLEVGNYTKK